MAIVLNGTTGIAVPLGSAAAPGVVNTTSATTGIYNPTSTTLGLSTNGTNAVYIDASQNVGIGTSSPTALGAGRVFATINGSTDSGFFFQSGGVTSGYLQATSAGFNIVSSSNFNLALTAQGTGVIAYLTGGSERMRIDSSGNLLVGNTTSLIGTGGSIQAVGSSTNRGYLSMGRTTASTSGVCGSLIAYNATNTIASFDFQANGAVNSGVIQAYTYSAGSAVQGPYVNTGGTSWTTASDENLKDIIEPIENGVEKLSSLRSVIGKFKTDYDDVRRVFLIAQDVQKVLPEAICTDPNGYLGLNYQDLIPVLVKAIQELSAEVEALKAKVGA